MYILKPFKKHENSKTCFFFFMKLVADIILVVKGLFQCSLSFSIYWKHSLKADQMTSLRNKNCSLTILFQKRQINNCGIVGILDICKEKKTIHQVKHVRINKVVRFKSGQTTYRARNNLLPENMQLQPEGCLQLRSQSPYKALYA